MTHDHNDILHAILTLLVVPTEIISETFENFWNVSRNITKIFEKLF